LNSAGPPEIVGLRRTSYEFPGNFTTRTRVLYIYYLLSGRTGGHYDLNALDFFLFSCGTSFSLSASGTLFAIGTLQKSGEFLETVECMLWYVPSNLGWPQTLQTCGARDPAGRFPADSLSAERLARRLGTSGSLFPGKPIIHKSKHFL
jgi:hypothetical protein